MQNYEFTCHRGWRDWMDEWIEWTEKIRKRYSGRGSEFLHKIRKERLCTDTMGKVKYMERGGWGRGEE